MKKRFFFYTYTFHFWPLIALGGRLVVRVLLNLWDMLES